MILLNYEIMITEDFVSYEVAKLLKEKGFDIPCNCYGTYNGINLTYRLCITDKYTNWNKHSDSFIISCPTLQMAMKWLKTIHNLYIVITPSSDCRFVYEIYKIHSNYPTELKLSSESEEFFNEPEDACDAAIKYCLEKLIL